MQKHNDCNFKVYIHMDHFFSLYKSFFDITYGHDFSVL